MDPKVGVWNPWDPDGHWLEQSAWHAPAPLLTPHSHFSRPALQQLQPPPDTCQLDLHTI
jgi:hypothetical protein